MKAKRVWSFGWEVYGNSFWNSFKTRSKSRHLPASLGLFPGTRGPFLLRSSPFVRVGTTLPDPCSVGGGRFYATEAGKDYAKLIEILNISDGATVQTKNNELIQLDSATTVHLLGDEVVRVYSTKGAAKTLLKVDNNNSAVSIHNTVNIIDKVIERTVTTRDNKLFIIL